MSLRFRRSVRLFPGVRLNFSRSGISTTVGVRGASMTLGPRGTYANVGLPGSGLSYRTKVSAPRQRTAPRGDSPPTAPRAAPEPFAPSDPYSMPRTFLPEGAVEAAQTYGSEWAKKFFARAFAEVGALDAA